MTYVYYFSNQCSAFHDKSIGYIILRNFYIPAHDIGGVLRFNVGRPCVRPTVRPSVVCPFVRVFVSV